jgi:hypothetical protein
MSTIVSHADDGYGREQGEDILRYCFPEKDGRKDDPEESSIESMSMLKDAFLYGVPLLDIEQSAEME